jgi:hypothetical protein
VPPRPRVDYGTGQDRADVVQSEAAEDQSAVPAADQGSQRGRADEPHLGHIISRGPRQAQLDGFDLHANVWVHPNNRARVLVKLKTVWRDGTSHFLFEPIEFLEKLAALIPRPGVNLLLYYGVLTPRARWRSQVVRYGRPTPEVIGQQDAARFIDPVQAPHPLRRFVELFLGDALDLGFGRHAPGVVCLGQGVDLWTSRPGRGLSLVADDLDGKPVVTVKGVDAFGVATPGNLSRYVIQLRSALRAIGTAKFASGDQYSFGLDGDANLGKPEDLHRALKLLARDFTGRAHHDPRRACAGGEGPAVVRAVRPPLRRQQEDRRRRPDQRGRRRQRLQTNARIRYRAFMI